MTMPPRTLRIKCSTIDVIYKPLGSYLLPRDGQKVPSMDSYTASELEGSVIYESNNGATASLAPGYTIEVAFRAFATAFQSILPLKPESLTIPWQQIPEDIRAALLPITSEDAPAEYPDWQLYNPFAKRWRWLFDAPNTPSNSDEERLTVSTKRHIVCFFNAITNIIQTLAPSLANNGSRR